MHSQAFVYFKYHCVLVNIVGQLRKLRLKFGEPNEITAEVTEKIRVALK